MSFTLAVIRCYQCVAVRVLSSGHPRKYDNARFTTVYGTLKECVYIKYELDMNVNSFENCLFFIVYKMMFCLQ